MLRFLTYTTFTFLFLLVMFLPARSHMAPPTPSHPLGWKYSGRCCSDKDCMRVGKHHVIEGPDGITIKLAKGEHPMITMQDVEITIPYTSDKIQESPDGEYHVCHGPQSINQSGEFWPGALYCVYVPPKGY